MWTKEQSAKFKTPNYSKLYIRKPIILALLKNLKSKRVIELGCGSGYWTRILAEKGAKCFGVDKSKEQLNLAIEEENEKPLGIKYVLGDITNLKGIPSKSFDLVFIEFVILEIPNKNLIGKIFKEASRVLKRNGEIFISEMHPFDPIVDNRFQLPKNFNYFQSGAKMIARARQLNGSIIEFADYHWTLEDIIGELTKAGFVITSLKEPNPSKELFKKIPYLKYREGLPKDIIIIGKKIV